jgi:5S rRNA maturation endonuclease (ribonuclease M5)
MIDLYKQAIVKVKYADNFMVMRFPEGHFIKQKYAPFTLNNDQTWSMKRPEGLLPIYYTDKHRDMPIIINEGEKALRGCEAIYKGDSCTWHGGVNSWEKADWSPIFDRDVWIFPDNDEAGMKCANEIAKMLKKNGCKVKVAQPPESFNEKDDLYDAYIRGYFKESKDLEEYIINCTEKKPKGAVTFTRADEVLRQVDNPDWLIKDVVEKESLMCIFGAPKSGKSFIAIAMAACIAKGERFYGNKAYAKPVMYVCGEGQRGVKRRLAAWQQGMFDLNNVPLYLSDRAVRVNDPDDFKMLEEEIEALTEQVGEIGMIVIDTFQRNFVGNENSAEDVGNFINKLDGLISHYKCCVCLVHHTGHGNSTRGRGSSVMGASLDYEFKVERDDQPVNGFVDDQMLVSFEQTLNKDGQGMAVKNFMFKEVQIIGEGLNLTSGFLEETDVELKVKKKTGLPPMQQRASDALRTVAMIKDSANPQNIYLKPADLEGYVKNLKGDNIDPDNIRQHLKALRDKNKVVYDPDWGYQHEDFKNIPPNFDEKG